MWYVNMALPQSSVGRNALPNLPDRETLLQQTYLEAFKNNYDSVQRWMRWKEDHEKVKSTLSSLPDKLSHEVVIPFGSKALMKAKLVHTNEVLTSIGSSWFVKQSAKQGIAMCERRICQSEAMLSQLESERTLLTNRQTLPKLEEAFPSDDTKEILEEYNEEVEMEWMRQHREREAEYRNKLAALRKSQIDNHPVQTEEDIFRRLDQLELEEELNDELERLHAEYEADCENNDEEDEGETTEEDEDCEDGNENEIEDKYTNFQDSETLLPKNRSADHKIEAKATEIDTLITSDYRKDGNNGSKDQTLSTFREAWGENPSVDLEKLRKNRRISFADEARPLLQSSKGKSEVDEHIYIRFHHSNVLSEDSSSKTPVAQSVKGEAPVYKTPADIFEIHKVQLISPQPKSILKKSSSYPEKCLDINQKKTGHTSASFGSSLGIKFSHLEDDDVNPSTRDLSHFPPILCDVQESTASVSQISNQETSQRPASRFKLTRQSGKRQ